MYHIPRRAHGLSQQRSTERPKARESPSLAPIATGKQKIFWLFSSNHLRNQQVALFCERDGAALTVFCLARIQSDAAPEQVRLPHSHIEHFGLAESVGVPQGNHCPQPKLPSYFLSQGAILLLIDEAHWDVVLFQHVLAQIQLGCNFSRPRLISQREGSTKQRQFTVNSPVRGLLASPLREVCRELVCANEAANNC